MDTVVRPDRSGEAAMPVRHKINWSAIVAATVATLGVWIMLIFFGSAVGLSTIDPTRVAESNSAARPAVTIAWLVISAIGSFFFGAWIGGHWSNVFYAEDAYIQGVAIWGLGLTAVTLLSASALNLGDRFKVTASNLENATQGGRTSTNSFSFDPLNDPKFVSEFDSRLSGWASKNAPKAVGVSANQNENAQDKNRSISPKEVSSSNELQSYAMANADLDSKQAENFLKAEQDSIAKDMTDAAKRFEQSNSKQLAEANRIRLSAMTAGWTMTAIAFLTLCASIAGSYVGWRQPDYDDSGRVVRNA